jgi:hypothetical protein
MRAERIEFARLLPASLVLLYSCCCKRSDLPAVIPWFSESSTAAFEPCLSNSPSIKEWKWKQGCC